MLYLSHCTKTLHLFDIFHPSFGQWGITPQPLKWLLHETGIHNVGECSLSQLALTWFTICQHFLLYLSSACQKQLMVNKREEEYASFYSWFIKSYDPEKKKKKISPNSWVLVYVAYGLIQPSLTLGERRKLPLCSPFLLTALSTTTLLYCTNLGKCEV